MHRIYLHKGELLFARNANLEKGTPMGSLIEAHPERWEFHPGRQGLTLGQMREIADKMESLPTEFVQPG